MNNYKSLSEQYDYDPEFYEYVNGRIDQAISELQKENEELKKKNKKAIQFKASFAEEMSKENNSLRKALEKISNHVDFEGRYTKEALIARKALNGKESG